MLRAGTLAVMSPTPAGVTILAQLADGTTVDVTEGVQTLYDHVIGSMDWGSGFLTEEDAIPIAEIARVCGFEECEAAEAYVHSAHEAEQRKAEARERAKAEAMVPPQLINPVEASQLTGDSYIDVVGISIATAEQRIFHFAYFAEWGTRRWIPNLPEGWVVGGGPIIMGAQRAAYFNAIGR